ncbi:MAG: hypothetical protein P9L97_06190 [Candidatus Tenebribacter davisii]|nr:hypothetical protein [Candidatus Tenebribacter davisii]
MEIQTVQLIQVVVGAFLIFATYKVKNNEVRIMLIIIMAILFLVNPIRFKQEGISKIERRSSTINTALPERVVVQKLTFKKQQAIDMAELKSDSKRSFNNEEN